MNNSRTYSVLIIDDDSIAIAELEQALSAHPDFSVAGSAQNAMQGKELLLDLQPDILFLDVELPDMQGIRFLNSVKDTLTWPVHVVFYSSHSKYILNAWRESAFDYLLKPFEQTELDGILSRFTETVAAQEAQPVPRCADCNPFHSNFLIATVTGYKMVKAEEIGYFEHKGLRKQWYAHLSAQETLPLKRGTSAEMILGYSPSFIQISQSVIINIDYLALINGKNCRLYPPFDRTEELTISRNFLRKLQERMNFI